MPAITSPIATERLLLRPFTPDDLEDLLAIYSNPHVVRYLYANVQSRDEVREVLKDRATQTHLAQEGDKLTLALVLPGAEETSAGVIGEIDLWWRSVDHSQGEIGFALHPAYQGRGLAAEAATWALQWAFREVGLHRVYGRADARNAASAGLMRRLGMRQEAHFIHNERFKGEWGEEVVFAILESEWKD
jgi:RimJ/RimL family protein N-acetyltransferase